MPINLKTIPNRVSAIFIITTESGRFDLERSFHKRLKTCMMLICLKNGYKRNIHLLKKLK